MRRPVSISSAVFGLIALTLTACVSSSNYRGESSAPTYPPYKGEVAILEKFPPRGTYERLGVITVRTEGVSYANTLRNRMRKEVAARGGNAVVLQGKEREGRDGNGHLYGILAGWAIRQR